MSTETKKSKITIKDMAVIALITAVTCILAPMAIPIGPVPISLTNLVIYFGLYILGTKKGLISYIIYLLIGLVGLPVFSGFTGGPARLFGPTGGYLIGFIPMAIIAGIFITRSKFRFVPSFIGMIIGTIVCYIMGTVWLSISAGMDGRAALMAGVIPFIPGDVIKMVLAAIIAPKIIQRLRKAGVDA